MTSKLKKQNPYDFKKELLKVHKKNIRNISYQPDADELELKNGVCIVIPEGENKVIYTAARDFADYLLVSMGISAVIGYCSDFCMQSIRLGLSQNLGEANGYMGYSITTNESGINVEGYDERGVAQGLYFLEDLMNIRRAPFVKYGNIKRKSLFEKRMTQSPFGMFQYPDEALALIAHYGYDTLDLWMKDAYTTLRGDYLDLNLLAERAEKYGIKINVELYAPHSKHPDEPDAQAFYDELYGNLFKVCPKIDSIILEGEANHFVSKDPSVSSLGLVENIPTGKPSPGWWPCTDYPQFVNMIKKSVRKYNPDAEIIFCTYNWGYAPEEDRIKLIENLPTDITLLATWDMFHTFKMRNSVEYIVDYSLCFVGPGEYFSSEAIAAQKKGIKLASITNTSGKTWDFGVIPYEPAPNQWIKRFKRIIQAHKEWGLREIQENIHYGFYPSIISDLEKWAFFTEIKPLEEVYQDLLKRDFEDNAENAKKAMECFSEAICHYSITNQDQYGAFRIGPAYPFWIHNSNHKYPAPKHAMFKGIYAVPGNFESYGYNSLTGTRIFDEIASLHKMKELIDKGIQILSECANANDKLCYLLNLAKFMYRTTITAIHAKDHYVLNSRLRVAETREFAEKLLDEITDLLLEEKENVAQTIPLVQVDSLLGWEPSMEYVGNEDALIWKLKQLDYELNYTLPELRKANSLVDKLFFER